MAVVNNKTIPDFFIVGAPKCGTTSLHYYLGQHPQIFMAKKELYYFGKDFTYREVPTSMEYYLSCFKDAPMQSLAGDASVWYLYSKTAAKEIKQFNPEAKIIIMLRPPVDMIYSLHSEQLYNGNENIKSFKAALDAEKGRREGKLIPPYIGCPIEGLQYRKTGKYYNQVKRYINEFGAEKVRVVFLKDFNESTKGSFTGILKFLGLNPNVEIDFSIKNKSKVARSRRLTAFLRYRSQWFMNVVKFLIPVRNWRQQIQEYLWKLNAKSAKRPALDNEMRAELNKYFLEDIEQLELFLNKDLTYWK